MIYVSYHNIDCAYAFQLSNLLIRYYRNVWLDRFEIDLTEDWNEMIREARSRATGVIAIVTDDYLESPYCRAEYEYFRGRDLAITAVIPRDFSTDMIAEFTFGDWVDFRRWFDDPSDLSVENLLSQVPQSEAVAETGERLDYLRGFIQAVELALAKMPTSWAALRNSDAQGGNEIRPRMFEPSMLTDWDFTVNKAGNELPVENLLEWSRAEPQFIIQGKTGSGKTCFARLLALQQAHNALRDDGAAVPVWLDLAQWTSEHRSLNAFVESQWTLLTYWQHWLDQRETLLVLDNWSDLARSHTARVTELRQWIDASPGQRFIVLSAGGRNSELDLPTARLNAISAGRAQSFVSGWLTLEQQNSFRQILKQKHAFIAGSLLDNLSIGVELLSADRALAFNQWQANPMPAMIALRSKQAPQTSGGLDAKQLLAGLQQLAWSTMLQDNHRFVPRDTAIDHSIDPRVFDRGLELGVLDEAGTLLRFHCEMFQWYLAAERLKKDGLSKYLTRPEFADGRGRIPKKWDNLALVLVHGLPEGRRAEVVEQIAEIDPFIAAMCLKRYPDLNPDFHESLMAKLVDLCAQNPAGQSAFRGAIAELPDAEQTAQLLIGQMSRCNNAQQLWLWLEVRALPLELPIDFIGLVAEIERGQPALVNELLKDYRLPWSLAYLVKLSTHQNASIRRNAIWMLGEMKYLPTAILLLHYLDDSERSDHDEIVLALMKYAYSEVLARLLRWSQDHPKHRKTVITALAKRKRLVTSRLLALSDARRLRLHPGFYDLVVDMNETDIAIGLAQIAEGTLDLPESLSSAILAKPNAAELRARIASSIKHLPNRDGFQQLLGDISQVLDDPPETIIAAGSNIEALLYGQPLFDDVMAQAAPSRAETLPIELLQQLRHADPEQRRLALKRLADYPPASALPALLEAAHDEVIPVRLEAYGILVGFERELAARKAIFAALTDPNRSIVNAVIDMLKTQPSVDCDALVDLLDSANPMTVAAAIDLLGHARHRPATAALGQLLNDERMPANHGATIGQLARQALDEIESSVMEGDNARSTTGATSGLGGEGAAPGFSDEEKIIRTLKVLRDDDWGRTQKAAKFLRKFARHLRGADNPQVLRLLCDALNDDNWSVRWAAAEALAMLRDQAATAPLSGRINDPSWIVQVAVLRALAELGASGLAARLTPLLRSSRKAVRQSAAEALGEMGDPKALPALATTLKRDTDEFVRFAALNGIIQLDSEGARTYLELALSDGSVHLRHFAMERLAPQMNETDLPILKQLLNDHNKPSWEDESLHDLAVATLRRIGSVESLALLDSSAYAENRTGA
ncbi:MAG: HEAT repeat domain-containing protein [Chloroflexi bacterium]|nr:HEAT repeat domain-containing protein [Chloroflexota bacterium]